MWIGLDRKRTSVKFLKKSVGWIGIKRRIGFGGESILSYRFQNEVVSLYFEKRKILYRISVGVGCQGGFLWCKALGQYSVS